MPTKRSKKISRILWVLILAFLMVIVTIQLVIAAGSVTLNVQYRDVSGDWTTGAINAGQGSYPETGVVPFYVSFDVDNLDPVIFTIDYDYYKDSDMACGYGNLATYNDWVTSFVSYPGTDPNTNTGRELTPLGDIGEPGETLYSFNTNGVTLSGPVITNGTGDQFGHVTVTFTPSNTTDPVEFYYGLRIQKANDCGTNTFGATYWSGGSVRARINEGAALSINPGGIIAIISGIKFFDVNGDGIYSPTASAPNGPDYPLGGWTVDLYSCGTDSSCASPVPTDTQQTDSNDGSYVFLNLTDTYWYIVCEVMETDSTKWEPTVLDIPDTTGNPIPIVSGEACFSPFQYALLGDSIVRDFGNWLGPTAVTLMNFTADLQNQVVLVNWQTALASEVLGFNLYRSLLEDGSDKVQIAYLDVDFDNLYEYTDQNVSPGEVYYYWLEALYLNGTSEIFGPSAAGYLNRVYLPVNLNGLPESYPY